LAKLKQHEESAMPERNGSSLSQLIFDVTGEKVSGSYTRYKSKKWHLIGSSNLLTPCGNGTYLLCAADFNDKHGVPYTFLVAVDVAGGSIIPVDEFDEESQQELYDVSEYIVVGTAHEDDQSASAKKHKIWLAELSGSHVARHADPSRPQLVIGTCIDEPIKHLKKLNRKRQSKSGSGKAIQYRARMDLLEELPKQVRGLTGYVRRRDAKKRMRIIREYFQSEGYVIGGNPDSAVYTVYVVNLTDATGTRKNPREWVYVGQTSRTPEERLRQHLDGYKASKWVTKFGIDLNEDLMAGIPQARFNQDALFLESTHAARLEAEGFNVKGGH
jgi:hypothetical protein